MFHSLVWPAQLGPPYTTQEPATHAVMLPLHLTPGIIFERKQLYHQTHTLFSLLLDRTGLVH